MTGEVAALPAPSRPQGPRHVLGGAVVLLAGSSDSGHEQHERTCAACRAVRITAIASDGRVWRAWRKGAGMPWIAYSPPCSSAGGQG